MTVHMFRCHIGKGGMSVSDLETRIDDWVQSNAEWADDLDEHTIIEYNTEIDGSGDTYHSIPVRFLQEDTKDNLLQKFTDKVKDKIAWYRVGYHECSHDKDNSSPCEWQDKVEWTDKDVTIPDGVPDFEVAQ